MGCQLGLFENSDALPPNVSCCTLLPSGLAENISGSTSYAILVPSGDQLGRKPPPGMGSGVWPLPFAAILTSVPSRSKTIRPPSGDQSGLSSLIASEVNAVPVPPAAATTQMSWFPSCTPRAKAIRVPSGDHAGVRSSWSEGDRLVTPVPSAFMT
jgi:hypothetical protein